MNQKGLAPILIVLLIAAAVGGYLVYSGKVDLNQKLTPAYRRPPDATTMSKSQNDETANWKTYQDLCGSYSYSCPSANSIPVQSDISKEKSAKDIKCSQDYLKWVKDNCPDFQSVSH